ncbi:MAG: 30S ribosomal protein S13 [Candidatus Lokiarchaeota archaeon]|nr:30S ribosomal protein S13 [Candidatus Lokiarchaeota archaeon]
MSQKPYIKNTEFRSLIRMIGTSLEGDRLIENGISQIKGVGRRIAQAIVRVAGIDPNTRIGMLTEDQCEELEKMIKNPTKFGIPHWMVNRQKDLKTGEDRHVSGTDINLMLKIDIDRMKRTNSWKGIRHKLGLKVRGQRTRCTGRSGLTVGYYRKKAKEKEKKKTTAL